MKRKLARGLKKPQKPGRFTRSTVILAGAGLLALSALAGITLRHSFLPAPAPVTSITRSATSGHNLSYRERIQAASQDKSHGFRPGPFVNPRFYSSKETNLLFPGNPTCVRCHDFKQLPPQVGRAIMERDQAVRALFDPKDTHSDISNAIIMFPEYASRNQELAGTHDSGLAFNLPNFADPALREDILGHELAHFHTEHAGDYLHEAWVVPANMLAVGPQRLAHVDEHNLATKYVALLQRVARLQGKMPSALEPNNHKSSATSLRTCAQYLTHQDVSDGVRHLFRKCFSEYRKNNVFWDAAVYEFQNQYTRPS